MTTGLPGSRHSSSARRKSGRQAPQHHPVIVPYELRSIAELERAPPARGYDPIPMNRRSKSSAAAFAPKREGEACSAAARPKIHASGREYFPAAEPDAGTWGIVRQRAMGPSSRSSCSRPPMAHLAAAQDRPGPAVELAAGPWILRGSTTVADGVRQPSRISRR